MNQILIISSCIHKDLSTKQLMLASHLIKQAGYPYEVEIVTAGAYEIPFVINTYEKNKPFDAYMALGLILNANKNHFDYIMSHLNHCFTHFALNNVIVGNGIIAAPTKEDLQMCVESNDACLSAYPSAFNAIDYLLKLKNKMF